MANLRFYIFYGFIWMVMMMFAKSEDLSNDTGGDEGLKQEDLDLSKVVGTKEVRWL